MTTLWILVGFVSGAGTLTLVNVVLAIFGREQIGLTIKLETPQVDESIARLQDELSKIHSTLESIKAQTKPTDEPLPTQRW